MTTKEYRANRESFFAGKKAILYRKVRSGYVVIPEGTTVTITRKYKGFSITGPPCEHCGLCPIMTQVEPQALILINPPADEEKGTPIED